RHFADMPPLRQRRLGIRAEQRRSRSLPLHGGATLQGTYSTSSAGRRLRDRSRGANRFLGCLAPVRGKVCVGGAKVTKPHRPSNPWVTSLKNWCRTSPEHWRWGF